MTSQSDVAINLIGKYFETKHPVPTRRADGRLSHVNSSFEEVNVDIPRKLARIARETGVEKFIHVRSRDLAVWGTTGTRPFCEGPSAMA
jgi:hypothetical protein